MNSQIVWEYGLKSTEKSFALFILVFFFQEEVTEDRIKYLD